MGILIAMIYIVIIVLSVKLMVTAIQFFENKTRNDNELLQKLDKLIRVMAEKKD